MIFYQDLFVDCSFWNYLSVLAHGLRLDASMGGYLTLIPGLFIIVSFWLKQRVSQQVLNGYFLVISFVISIIFIVDIALYRFWGFRLDSTPLFYLKSPKDAIASANWFVNFIGLVSIIASTYAIAYFFRKIIIVKDTQFTSVLNKIFVAFVMLFCVACLILPIRGGVSASTMNVGKVYFSEKQILNHAAVNPVFSFFEALTFEQDFDKQYRFMKEEEAEKLFATMVDAPANDSIPVLFKVKRPNVIIVVLESFMSNDLEILGGLPNVAVRMNGLCSEGVLFTNAYANSFRTDRGLVAVLSGYPGQTNTSIMKYARKAQSLPAIPKSMKGQGYDVAYYYGGDADFTNMRSYLISMGIDKITSVDNFSSKQNSTNWGVPDHVLFERVTSELSNSEMQKKPFLKVIQTLSSHQPYDVPYHRLDEPYLNSVAYTDSCLGSFIDNLKKSENWDNTVVVMVPDHAMRYPYDLDNRSVDRYKIPILMVGGALKAPKVVDTYCSQIDISATLLSQLGIDHKDFRFSKNILNPASPHFGCFAFQEGFGMVTPDNQYVYDCESKIIFMKEGIKDKNKKKAEAFIQTLYNDLQSR